MNTPSPFPPPIHIKTPGLIALSRPHPGTHNIIYQHQSHIFFVPSIDTTDLNYQTVWPIHNNTQSRSFDELTQMFGGGDPLPAGVNEQF